MSLPEESPSGSTGTLREVPIAWEALEDAFENNAPEVHSYLHQNNGEVLRIVDGIADPGMHNRIMADSDYLRIDPVSSREQYRWMERFIVTVEDQNVAGQLTSAIDGKGAFRRFKDVLMSYPVDRERWFAFRSERLRACMETWLEAHGVRAVDRPKWRVPTADEVRPQVEQQEQDTGGRPTRAVAVEAQRERVRAMLDALPARELDAAIAYLEFLRDRRHVPRPSAKVVDVASAAAKTEDSSEQHSDDSSEQAAG